MSEAESGPQLFCRGPLAGRPDVCSSAFVAATRAKESLVDLISVLPVESPDRPALLLAIAVCRAIIKDATPQ